MGGLLGVFGFFFILFLLFTFLFLYFMHVITIPVKVRKPSLKILRWLLYVHICVLIRLSEEKKRDGFSFLMPVGFASAVVD